MPTLMAGDGLLGSLPLEQLTATEFLRLKSRKALPTGETSGDPVGMLSVLVSSKDHILGNPDAECTLVWYGDYECSDCLRAEIAIKKLRQKFGDRVRYVFRHFPVTEVHPYAELAAESAEFAASKRMFWEMHDLLFENQDRLGDPLLQEVAETLNLDPIPMLKDLEDRIFEARVHEDILSDLQSGVRSTPTFFIDGKLRHGLNDYEHLREALDRALRKIPKDDVLKSTVGK